MRPILERHFRAVLDNAPDGVLVEARDSIAYVNAAYARLLGKTRMTAPQRRTLRDAAAANAAPSASRCARSCSCSSRRTPASMVTVIRAATLWCAWTCATTRC